MKSFLRLGLLLVGLTIIGCSESEPAGPGDTGSTSEAIDQTFFKQIKGFGDILAENKIWNGYAYNAVPQYVIYVSGSKAVRGFLINPGTPPSGATKLGDSENEGLNVYRYDSQMQEAYNVLFGTDGNQAFDFNFAVGNEKFYIQIYNDDETNAPHQGVDLSVHENFHAYQNNWQEIQSWVQQTPDFPVTQELVELQILCAEIFRGLPNTTTDAATARRLLSQYVAIRSRELAIDPSPGKLIRNMELPQEWSEGTAKYLEVMVHRQHFGTDTKIMDYTLLDIPPQSMKELKESTSFNILYNTGGAAIWLMRELGVTIEDMEQGKTPYDVASAYLNLSQSELDAALDEAKKHSRWGEIQTTAAAWIKLP